ncbi:MAG: hypothetical protein ABI761_01445 [Saprospiraceae bacterium]
MWSAIGWGSGLMILSGAWLKLKVFLGLPKQYLVWMESYKYKYQAVLDESLGLSPFFPLKMRTVILNSMSALLILTVWLMIRFYKKDTHRFYLLAFLKLSLVIFYNLFIIPYQYLMYTSVAVSFALFYLYSNHEEKQFVI